MTNDQTVTRAEENARGRGMDYAATFCIDALANMLGVEDYRICDGTEEWEGDVRGTLWNILVAADVIDEEDGAISRHRTAHSGEGRSNGAGEAVSVPADHLLARGLRTSQKALDEINRQEQANIAGYIALRDFPVGSTSAQFPPDAVGPNKLGTDWQAIAAQLREISRISNDYDLRAAIEGHGNGLGDSGIWRDLMDQCDRLAALSAPQGEVEREGALLVLDRLHRGDVPRMVPMTTVQGGRLIFTNRADVDVFIEAYRRGDNAASFTVHEVPRIDVRIFWQSCRDHDWHYANSDDLRVYREGGAVASQLAVQQTISREHRRIYQHWKKHHETGPAYGTVRHPAPEEPALAQPEAGGEHE